MANPPTNLDYFVVDVFTETPLAGNALAVVENTCGLTTERMQAIAREFNLSETTFIERRSAEVERAEGVLVRIFTTQEELPFAGHPALGTASVLKMIARETLRGDTLTLSLKVGPIPVRFEAGAEDAGAIFGEMTQREPEFGAELDAAAVAPLLGLAFEDMDPALPPQVVSTGAPFAIVALKTVEALARLKVNQDAATAWLRERGARWFYVVAPDLNQDQNSSRRENESDMKYRARMQFNGGEDPATGSAAGCAISYLVARGAVPSGRRVHVRQGVEMGRPSDLFLSAKKDGIKDGTRFASGVTEVRVAGSTILVAKGQLFLP
jgi:trans-2,3-dihydro-3-hydroxyanthranilate isomerase